MDYITSLLKNIYYSFEEPLEFDRENYKNFTYAQKKKYAKLALEKDISVIEYIPKEILEDNISHRLVNKILEKEPLYLEYLPDILKKDEFYSRRAIEDNFHAIKFTKNIDVLNDKKLFLYILENEPLYIRYASDNLKKDYELVIIAVTKNKLAKNFISEKIINEIFELFN